MHPSWFVKLVKFKESIINRQKCIIILYTFVVKIHYSNLILFSHDILSSFIFHILYQLLY